MSKLMLVLTTTCLATCGAAAYAETVELRGPSSPIEVPDSLTRQPHTPGTTAPDHDLDRGQKKVPVENEYYGNTPKVLTVADSSGR